jgi:negative regulator of flagellin synthesis FlgM
MRIIDTYGRFNNPTVDGAKKGAAPAGPTPKADAGDTSSAGSAGGEKVTVSAQAQEMARKAAAQADTAKVTQLRSAIENGTFKVDHQAIAKRIVDGA